MSGVRISDGSPTAAEEILWRLVFLIINKSRIYTEPSPSGKATDFDSVIGGSTPPTPANILRGQPRFFIGIFKRCSTVGMHFCMCICLWTADLMV